MHRSGDRTRAVLRTAGRGIGVFALAASAAALLALAACGGDDATGPAITGEYTLVQANGEPLPALVYDSVWVDEETGNEALIEAFVEEGRLDLFGSGSYDLSFVIDVLQDGEPLLADEEVSESGDFTVDGSTVRLTPTSGPSTTGTVDGDEISFTASSDEYGTFTLTFRD